MLLKTLGAIFSSRADVPAQAGVQARKYGPEREGLVLFCAGMGDGLFAIPVLRKLVALHPDKTFDLITRQPELFRACPYVDKVMDFDDPAVGDYSVMRKLFDVEQLRHWEIDTMDFISVPAGLGQLSFREKRLEYFPQEEDRAQAYDVVLNTSVTWPTRTWKLENWQRLANTLTAKGLRVAVVGKDVDSPVDGMHKLSPPLDGCENLVNRLSLDQTYFTIKKAGLFVSCQNGLSVLAGTTDTEIVVLGMSIEWSKRAIYRHDSPFHKITYANGACDLHCASSQNACPRPDFKFDGNFKCVPAYDVVEAAVLAKLSLDRKLI